MAPHAIRIIGDPVLKQKAADVSKVDGSFVKLVDDMFVTMYDAPGVGLAAPQVGVQQRFFVYDYDDEPGIIINPDHRREPGRVRPSSRAACRCPG